MTTGPTHFDHEGFRYSCDFNRDEPEWWIATKIDADGNEDETVQFRGPNYEAVAALVAAA